MAITKVWGKSMTELFLMPWSCTVLPWNVTPCTSVSVPRPSRCQATVSPLHMSSLGRLENRNPLMAGKQKHKTEWEDENRYSDTSWQCGISTVLTFPTTWNFWVILNSSTFFSKPINSTYDALPLWDEGSNDLSGFTSWPSSTILHILAKLNYSTLPKLLHIPKKYQSLLFPFS